MLCYFFIIVAHEHVVKYSINSTSTEYNTWNILAIIYTVFSLVGWFIAVNGSRSSIETD